MGIYPFVNGLVQIELAPNGLILFFFNESNFGFLFLNFKFDVPFEFPFETLRTNSTYFKFERLTTLERQTWEGGRTLDIVD